MKYQSEIVKEIIDSRGHEKSSLHYQSECIETWIKESEGSYPKLCEYEGEWLNYINENPIGKFPYETLTDVTIATVNNVVPFAYKSAILSGNTLVNLMSENERFSASLDGTNPSFWAYKYFTLNQNLKPNTSYTLIFNANISQSHLIHIGGKTGNAFNSTSLSNVVNGVNKLLITTYSDIADKEMNKLFIQSNNSKVVEITLNDFILIEGDHTNEDIPYFTGMQSVKMPVLTTSNEDGTKTNILTVNEEVELRKVGDAQDELNLLTGEVVERTIKGVLDGSEKWSMWIDRGESSNIISFYFDIKNVPNKNNIVINDKFATYDGTNESHQYYSTVKETIMIAYGPAFGTRLCVGISKDKATNLSEFKAWLSSNNINYIVETNEKAHKTVDLSVVNQDGTELSKIKPIEGTMHITTSGTPINPLFSGEIPVEVITQNLNSFIRE